VQGSAHVWFCRQAWRPLCLLEFAADLAWLSP
jgi:hypothetical protein